MNLILSQVLNIQGTPATIIGDQMVAGAILLMSWRGW